MAVVLTTGNFEEEVYQADMPVLVDFYADWWGLWWKHWHRNMREESR